MNSYTTNTFILKDYIKRIWIHLYIYIYIYIYAFLFIKMPILLHKVLIYAFKLQSSCSFPHNIYLVEIKIFDKYIPNIINIKKQNENSISNKIFENCGNLLLITLYSSLHVKFTLIR